MDMLLGYVRTSTPSCRSASPSTRSGSGSSTPPCRLASPPTSGEGNKKEVMDQKSHCQNNCEVCRIHFKLKSCLGEHSRDKHRPRKTFVLRVVNDYKQKLTDRDQVGGNAVLIVRDISSCSARCIFCCFVSDNPLPDSDIGSSLGDCPNFQCPNSGI